jgi:hypothetical protein
VDAGERRAIGVPGLPPLCDTRDAFGEVSSPRWLSPLLSAPLLSIAQVGLRRILVIGRARVRA